MCLKNKNKFNFLLSCSAYMLTIVLDLLFTYITHEFGGAYAMYRYAKQKDKEIYQLGNRMQKQKEGS